jgi:hypothetical protein
VVYDLENNERGYFTILKIHFVHFIHLSNFISIYSYELFHQAIYKLSLNLNL